MMRTAVQRGPSRLLMLSALIAASCALSAANAQDNLWTGIGRARSGCGAAIVGNPDQVLAKLNAYRERGIDAFILSGYPHLHEADLFARHVLPRLDHGPLRLSGVSDSATA